MRYIFSFIFLCATLITRSQEDNSIYKVGYRNFFVTDSSRGYKPRTQPGASLHYRPLEIDIWYPALSSGAAFSSVEYGQLLRLLQDRSNRFQDDTVYRDITKDLLASLCAGLSIADTSALSRLKTISYANAAPVRGPFPLIIYMCSFNGMSFENIHLLENLASHGYVVASVTSVGRYPGNMGTDPADLREQVGDGLFTLHKLKTWPNVDPTRVGVIGYSWGGPAALLLSMNSSAVKAILSLDGSEMHYYGESAEEDSDFNLLRQSPLFSLERLHSSYTYLESGDKQSDRSVDSVFDILPLLSGSHRYIRFPAAKHEDFSSFPALAAQVNASKNDGRERLSPFDKFAQFYFDQQLKDRPGALSTYLAGIWLQHADSAYPIAKPLDRTIFIRGRIFDSKDRSPLAYVNVGVPDKNRGTVTRPDGSFTLAIDRGMGEDSLALSMAGYRRQTMRLSRLLRRKQPVDFFLDELVADLKEVVVVSPARITRRIGNRTTSKSVSVGFPLRYLGAEIGVRMKLGRRPVTLSKFNFNVSSSRIDTALFRLNIYSFDKGNISGSKLAQSILVPIGRSVGAHTVDLSPYHLTMSGEILVSLELIEGSSSASQPGALFLSAGFLNASTWRRPTSQAAWKKAPGVGVGFNLVVRE